MKGGVASSTGSFRYAFCMCVFFILLSVRYTTIPFKICIHYNMHYETFFLSVYLFDRFMTMRCGVDKQTLQLIAIGCLMIAAKIEVSLFLFSLFRLYLPNINNQPTTYRRFTLHNCRIISRPVRQGTSDTKLRKPN